MLQRYKLRLGDGTVLAVDHDGLSVWLGDRKALVQPVGSTLWKPLKQFLAQERSAARRAARRQPKPPSTERAALPLVYPNPREAPAAGPPGAKVPAANEPVPVRADGLPLIPSPPEAPPPRIPPKPPDDQVVVYPARASASARASVIRPSLPKTPPAPVLATPLITPTPVTLQPPAEPPVVQPLAEEPASFSTDGAPALQPSDEDVGWMTLPKPLDDETPALLATWWRHPLEPSSVGAGPSLLQEAPRRAPSRAHSAFETLLSHWINSLARRVWQAYGALIALWKSLAREERPSPSFSPGEPAPSRAVDSARSSNAPGVYSPRRSAHDGLPILQLEPLDDEERASDDAPEIVLEPLDDPPVRLRAKG